MEDNRGPLALDLVPLEPAHREDGGCGRGPSCRGSSWTVDVALGAVEGEGDGFVGVAAVDVVAERAGRCAMPAWSLLGLNHLSRAGLFQLTTTADVCLPDTAQRRCTASERLWQPTLRRCRPADPIGRSRGDLRAERIQVDAQGGESKDAREAGRVLGTAGPQAGDIFAVLGELP